MRTKIHRTISLPLLVKCVSRSQRIQEELDIRHLQGKEQSFPIFEARDLQTVEVVAAAVSKVMFKQQMFAYKVIDRILYIPEDTESLLEEIEVLAQLDGVPHIAQLVGMVATEDPYKTYPSTDLPPVITGFLLEYHPGGTLQQILESDSQFGALPIQWALQIGTALRSLHNRRRTHLDIKPPNVVLDVNQNAILIDVSGSGAFEWDWLAPEVVILMQQTNEAPGHAPFEARVATDCWAYGRIISALAENSGNPLISERLQSIADGLTKATPESRISLCDALAQLSGGV
ncbi:unnamed protein product [Penicillium salamii]|nr:unnamed protein product [Penicillium salamii]CAG8408225.1 unnamed protein product [Penicillium salamii]